MIGKGIDDILYGGWVVPIVTIKENKIKCKCLAKDIKKSFEFLHSGNLNNEG